MMERDGNTWFRESIADHVYQETQITDILYSRRSAFQWIQVIETLPFGRILALDGKTQSAESDEFIYHETLVHPAMIGHPSPQRVFIAGGGEGATLREVISHNTVEKAVMVDIDKEVVEVARRYLSGWHQGAFDDPRVELHYEDARDFLRRSDAQYDVIIVDLSDPVLGNPSALLYTREFYDMVMERLTAQGVMAVQAESAEHGRTTAFTGICNTLASVFPRVYPYAIAIPSFGAEWGFVMGSKSPDPTVLSPQEVDRAVSARIGRLLKAYDGVTHNRVFALPKFLREELKAETKVITEREPLVVA
ncbi:MAG: polyamine aminopropyltransferase [Dehalococcoidia bacterium]